MPFPQQSTGDATMDMLQGMNLGSPEDATADLESRVAPSSRVLSDALQTQSQAQQPAPSPTQNGQNENPRNFFKRLLTNFAYGASQAGLKASGLPTDLEQA